MRLLVLALLALPAISFAQLPGERLPKPVRFSDSLSVGEGDTILVQRGSLPTGNFAYLQSAASLATMDGGEALDRGWNGIRVVVSQFRHLQSKRFGNKFYAVINPTGMRRVLVELPVAVEAGEVKVINRMR